jgi:sterol desaturase/sphingolipid hydroxylase (fatty acid hydroxylase superfamily)
MGISLSNTTSGAGRSWPTWVRALVLIVGVAVSAAVGYLTAVAVWILAVALGAAPLLAGGSTPQQPWVTPVAVGAGMIVFGLGVWFSARTVHRHPVAS